MSQKFKHKLKRYLRYRSAENYIAAFIGFPAIMMFFPLIALILKEERDDWDIYLVGSLIWLFVLIFIMTFTVNIFDHWWSISLVTFIAFYIISLIPISVIVIDDINKVELSKAELRDIKLKEILK